MIASAGAEGLPDNGATATLADVAAVTRRDGLAAGMTAAFDPRYALPCSASGRTLVPPGVLARVRAWQVADRNLPARCCPVEELASAVARSEGLALVRVDTEIRSTRTNGARLPDGAQWPVRLLAVRAGLGRRMLGFAIDQLAERSSGGRPLIDRQLVRAQLAEIAVDLDVIDVALDLLGGAASSTYTGASNPDVAAMHDRLDRTDRSLAQMFGAAGYLDDHPARALRLAALLRDVFAPARRAERAA